MNYTLILPANFIPCELQTHLQDNWLIPKKLRHFLRMRKSIQVNGENVPFHTVLQPGDELSLEFEPSDFKLASVLLGDAQQVTVIFEDEHLIVVEKPIRMKTHPNELNENDTLMNHVAAYLASKEQSPYVVHRLDIETSGLVLFAKNPFILPILSRMMEEKKVYRKYQALVTGEVTPVHFTINKKINRDRHDSRKQIIDETRGKIAITHVNVLKTDGATSLVSCDLETGRTHQIRVHLESIKHPIIGDPLYNPRSFSNRLMLHAYELTFTHPFTLEKIHCVSNNTL